MNKFPRKIRKFVFWFNDDHRNKKIRFIRNKYTVQIEMYVCESNEGRSWFYPSVIQGPPVKREN